VYGGSGGDQICGSDGADALLGGPGNDQLSGGDGADWLAGEDSDDELSGETGRIRWVGMLKTTGSTEAKVTTHRTGGLAMTRSTAATTTMR